MVGVDPVFVRSTTREMQQQQQPNDFDQSANLYQQLTAVPPQQMELIQRYMQVDNNRLTLAKDGLEPLKREVDRLEKEVIRFMSVNSLTRILLDNGREELICHIRRKKRSKTAYYYRRMLSFFSRVPGGTETQARACFDAVFAKKIGDDPVDAQVDSTTEVDLDDFGQAKFVLHRKLTKVGEVYKAKQADLKEAQQLDNIQHMARA